MRFDELYAVLAKRIYVNIFATWKTLDGKEDGDVLFRGILNDFPKGSLDAYGNCKVKEISSCIIGWNDESVQVEGYIPAKVGECGEITARFRSSIDIEIRLFEEEP